MRKTSLVLASVLWSAACATDVRNECPSWVTTEVSAGTAPTITWTPICPLDALSVTMVTRADSEPRLRWRIYSETAATARDNCRNLIWPPITYGENPCAGCTTDAGPLPLEAGVEYMVTLMTGRTSDWSGCHPWATVAWEEFTP
jgi:hypothetical protein